MGTAAAAAAFSPIERANLVLLQILWTLWKPPSNRIESLFPIFILVEARLPLPEAEERALGTGMG
jgi:hypothetical protein